MKPTPPQRSISFRRQAALAVLATVISIPTLHAANGSWNIDAAGNWSLTTNWTPAAVPGTAAGDIVDLAFNITAARTVTIDATSRTVGDLNIGDPTATVFAYTLASSAGTVVLNLDGAGSADATVDFTSNVANIISAPLTLVDNAVFRNNVATAQQLTGIISGAKTVTYNNDTNGVVNAATSGSGQFFVTGANTYSLGTTISDVRVQIQTSNLALGAAGSAVTIQNGGQVFNNTGLQTINYAFNIAGNGWLESGGALGALRLDSGAIVTGPVAMSANAAIGSNSGTGTVNGIVSGGFTLSKVGVGTLVLGGVNTYSGGTTITNGALQLNNNSGAGTQAINLVTGGTVGTATRLLINGGVTIGNAVNVVGNITGLAGQGSLQQTGTGLGTVNGAISITGSPTAGGHFVGGAAATNALVLNGPITSSVQVTQREGFVRYGGGGTDYNSLLVTNTAQVGATNGISTAATVTLGGSGSATLDLNGFDQTLASVSVGNSGNPFAGTVNLGAKTLTLNGDLTAVTSTGSSAHAINATSGGALDVGATNRNLVVNDNPALDDLTINGATITGTGGVTKTGAGTLALNGATIAGPLSINTGTLATGTGSQAGSFTTQSLAFADGTTLRMKIGASGDLVDAGVLTNAGTTTVRLNQLGGIVPNGTYPLINYTGASPGLAGFSLAPVGHSTSSLVDDGSTISLNVTGNDRVIWDGTNSTAWTTAATGNWKLQTGGAATDYIESDDVIFQDAPTSSTVALAANVSPSNVTFTNTVATAYTLSGAGGIIGPTSLTKTGDGSLTLSTPNRYTGPTTISAGTLNLTGGTLAGSSITVAAGATFNQSAGLISGPGATFATAGITTLTGANSFTGDVTLSGGTLTVGMGNGITGPLGSSPNPAATSKTLFITNNATFRNTTTFNDNVGSGSVLQVVFNIGSGGATFDTATGTTMTLDDGSAAGNANNAAQLQGAGNLTKVGPGTLSLGNGTSNFGTFTGQIFINEGTLTTGNASTNPFGTTAAGTTIASGAVLDVKGVSIGAEPLTISGTGISAGGALISSAGTGGAAAGPITLAADSSVGGAVALVLSGPISGGFGLTKVGAGTLTLSNAGNSYTGATNIAAGQITATAAGAIPAASDLVISGGILDPSNLTHTVASLSGTSGSIAQATAGTGTIRTTQSGSTNFIATLTRVKVDMSGTGVLTLGGTADNSTGTADVNSGTLVLAKTGDNNVHSIGAGGIGLVINSGGTVQIAGSTTGGGTMTNLPPTDAPANYIDQIFNLTDVVLNTGGTLDLNDHSEVIDALTGGGTVLNSGTGTSRLYTNNGSTTNVFAGSIQNGNGTLEVTKQGTGTLTLSGTNTYTGVTNVAAGRLNLQSNLAGSSVTVSDGASLSGDVTVSNLTVGTATSGNLIFNPNTAAALTAGTLTLNGSASTLEFLAAPTGAGPWTAINYTTLAGAGTLNLVNAGTYRVMPTVSIGAGIVSVDVTDTKNETWTGSVGGVWDSGATANTNWFDGVGADNFFGGDTVTFGDGPSVVAVTVTSGVNPWKTSVVSNTNNYTLTSTGSGITGPGNLEKSGSSTLTLVGPNTYSGQTIVTGGTLSFPGATSLGNASITNTIALSNGGRLSYNAATAVDLGGNRSINVGTGGGSISHNNAAAATITIPGNLTGSGTDNLSFHSNAAGAGTFVLTGNNSGYTGAISVDSGSTGITVLRILNANSTPTGGSITVNYPAAATAANQATTLDITGVSIPAAVTLNMTGFLTGGAVSQRSQVVGTGTMSINGPITMTGNGGAVVQFAPTGGELTLNGNITEATPGSFGVSGTPATLFLRQSGNTVVNGTIDLPNANVIRVDNTGITTINSTGNNWNQTEVRSASTLRIGVNDALDTGAVLLIGQATDAGNSFFDLNGFNQTVAGLNYVTGNGANTRGIINNGATQSTLTIDNTANFTFGNTGTNGAGNITGNIALVKNGTGAQTLAGPANTFTGGTTINAGKLIISADNHLGAVPATPTVNLTINGGTLQENTGFNMNANRRIAIGPNGATFLENATGNFNIPGVIQDAGPGAGALNITATNTGLYVPVGQNTYTGGTHLAAGSRAVINSASIGSATTNDLVSGPFGTGPLYMDGGSQRAPTVTPPAGGWVIGNAVQLTADSAFITGSTNTLTFTGPVTLRDGTRTITHNAGGNVIFSGAIDDDGSDFGLTLGAASTGRLVLSGVNTYGGGTSIEGGTLNVNADAALGDASGDVAISNGATLQASGTLTTAARTVTLGTGGGRIDTNGNDVTLDVGSTITGTSLTKVGTGTLILSGTQTYGTLNAEGATTVINSGLGTGTSTVNVDSSPALDADDPVTTVFTVSQTLSALNIGANGMVVLGSVPPSPAPVFEAGNSLDPDIETQGGDLVSNGAPVVPEPGVVALLLAGLSAIFSVRRRRD